MNNDTPLDMLQIKIDRAREELPQETRKAIDSVDWREVILGMREKKGYSYEQLEDLELETELLLCGLLNPVDYPKELEERLKLPRPQIDLLVNEMNELVFKKIKDELIRNSERKDIFVKKEDEIKPIVQNQNIPIPTPIKTIPITPIPTPKNTEPPKDTKPATPNPTNINLENEKTIKSILSQKLSGTFQTPTSKTEYSLDNISKTDESVKNSKDPYREIPQ